MITALMENLLKKDDVFLWSQQCQEFFDTMKAKMDSVPILVFSNWDKDFHVHMDASCIALGVVLTQPGE